MASDTTFVAVAWLLTCTAAASAVSATDERISLACICNYGCKAQKAPEPVGNECEGFEDVNEAKIVVPERHRRPYSKYSAKAGILLTASKASNANNAVAVASPWQARDECLWRVSSYCRSSMEAERGLGPRY